MKKIIITIFLTSFIILHSFSQADVYWEKDSVISSGDIGKFEIFNNRNLLGVAYSDTLKKFGLYIKYTTDGFSWQNPLLIVNKYFSNNEFGEDFSVYIDNDNILYVCYRENKNKFVILKITYPFNTDNIEKIAEIKSNVLIYLPKIYIDSNKDIHLLYSSNKENSFIILYKKLNQQGDILKEDIIGRSYKSALNPYIMEYNKTLYIVFQAKDEQIETGFFYNIILASSNTWGLSWTYENIAKSTGENNQSPYLLIEGGKANLVWEKEDKNFVSHIYYKTFDINRRVNENDIEKRISSETSEAYSPFIISFKNILNIFWYDNIGGSFQNYQCQIIEDEIFEPQIIKLKKGRTLDNKPVIFKNNLKYIWLQKDRQNLLYYIFTDTYVKTPKIEGINIGANHYTNSKNIKFRWELINDTSGIRGYKVHLTKNANEKIPTDSPLIFYRDTTKEYNNLADGEWYFKLKVYDNAGNESDESIFSFTVDTEPPMPPVFINQEYDEDGTLKNNSPVIKWKDADEELQSYRYYYKLYNAGNNLIQKDISYINEKSLKYTTNKEVQINNLDNGILLFGIQGIDKAGNKSEINWTQYSLNDYKAVTYISYIKNKINNTGDNVLEIYGRGFRDDGNIQAVYIDKDKKAPYDYTIYNNNYIVENDRFLKQLKEADIDDGLYYIGVHHPVRGIVFYNEKYNFSGEWIFKNRDENIFTFNRLVLFNKNINATNILLLIIGIVWILLILLIFKAILSTINEKIQLDKLILGLEEAKKELGEEEYLERRKLMRKKGLGLTFKYTLLILLLVISIVFATSFSLSAMALRNERRNLANEMKERANLVLENYEVTMAEIFTYEKGDLIAPIDATNNISLLPDIGFALFRQVTGESYFAKGGNLNVFFKGTNVDTLTDEDIEKIIREEVFTKETESLIEKYKKNPVSSLNIMPDYDPTKLSKKYIFIKPVLNKDTKALEAVIVLGYSFEKIIKLIRDETWYLIRLAFIVTLIAIFISVIGAVFLAATTIRPIRIMSKHVNVISTTEDYENLLGTENEKITVKSSDEIGILASSINDMTAKLIEKAKADKQMMLGKEIQKKFITMAPYEDNYINIYGFYEGAKGVSGDYFDYKKLDDNHYAFIICDVAGKAVPAALIMVQISTIFHSFCTNFNPKKDKIETVSIVNSINDTVAERGFSGRFAAILVLIVNIKTGKVLMTNAGYTQVLVYRDNKKKAEWIKLNDAGAAGVFPSYMLPNPYVQEGTMLNKGDIIYLFTDGIEESRNGRMIKNEKGEEHPEEFGIDRIKNIIDKSHGRLPKEVIDILIEEEKIFRGPLEQYDDLTILGIARK